MYIAPEIILGLKYRGAEVDVFSLGVVLFAMVGGKSPFRCANKDDKRYKLLADHKYDEFWKIFDSPKFYITEDCKDLI